MATAEHKLTTGVHAPSTRLLHHCSQLLICLAEQINDPRVRQLMETTEVLGIRLTVTVTLTLTLTRGADSLRSSSASPVRLYPRARENA